MAPISKRLTSVLTDSSASGGGDELRFWIDSIIVWLSRSCFSSRPVPASSSLLLQLFDFTSLNFSPEIICKE